MRKYTLHVDDNWYFYFEICHVVNGHRESIIISLAHVFKSPEPYDYEPTKYMPEFCLRKIKNTTFDICIYDF